MITICTLWKKRIPLKILAQSRQEVNSIKGCRRIRNNLILINTCLQMNCLKSYNMVNMETKMAICFWLLSMQPLSENLRGISECLITNSLSRDSSDMESFQSSTLNKKNKRNLGKRRLNYNGIN